MCANDACGGSLSSCFQSFQSFSSPSLLLASRASFVASSLAALHALHPQNALLVAGPLIPRFFSPSRMRLWCAPCGTPACCLTLAPKIVLVVTLWSPTSSNVARLSFPPFSSGNLILLFHRCFRLATATSLHNRPATPAVCDPGLTVFRYCSHTHSCALLTHVSVRPSVHYLPLLCVLCRLPSHRVHAWPRPHRVPHHFRGVL